MNQEYQKLEDEYQQTKAYYKFLKENGGNKETIKAMGTKLYKLALSQVTILQKVELNEGK